MTTNRVTLLCATALVLAAIAPAHAGRIDSFDLDAEFRARIAKEKVKLNMLKAQTFKPGDGRKPAGDPQCGSQQIGNIDTGGRIGAAPREVFVFAPNAINFVTANGCD
jgi:hypothetical protein